MNMAVTAALAAPTAWNSVALVPAQPSPWLGDVNDQRQIFTTCGWIDSGQAWVTGPQLAAAKSAGWQTNGRQSPFQGTTLFMVWK